MNVLRDAEEYRGRYFSANYIRKNILSMTDEEIEKIDEEIEEEKNDTKYAPQEGDMMGGGMGMGGSLGGGLGGLDSGLGGDLGISGISNIYYGSKYTFSVSFSGATAQLRGGSGAFQTYAATITDSLGNTAQTLSGTLSSTAISSIGLTYALADPTAALSTASDAYLLVDNVSFAATSPEPSVSLIYLFDLL